MRFWFKPTLLLATLSLAACAGSSPRYISGACQEQWVIPANLADPPQAPEAIQNLNTRLQTLTTLLKKRSQPASTTAPITPASSK